ncbi:MAG: YihY/virulence factor BrkB family protein [Pseudomonadota bacterium]
MSFLLTIWRACRRLGAKQLGLLSAGVAFYALLAVFPAIAAVLALAGLFTEPQDVVTQLDGMSVLLPDQAADILLQQASDVAGANDDGLSLALMLGVGFAIYLATRATTGMIHGLNVVHNRAETRGLVQYWATVVWLTASLFLGTVMLFLLLVGLPTVLEFLPQDILSLETADTLRGLRWIVVAVLFLVGLSLLFRFGPCGGCVRWVSPGLCIAGLLWFAGSFGFTIYVAEIADYNESFGSLGGVIVLLTWFWLSAFVVLFGALIDAEADALNHP